jgi:hypothetical protein
VRKRVRRNFLVKKENLAGILAFKPGKEFNQGCLAGAVGTDQAEKAALIYPQVNAVKGLYIPFSVRFMKVYKLDTSHR